MSIEVYFCDFCFPQKDSEIDSADPVLDPSEIEFEEKYAQDSEKDSEESSDEEEENKGNESLKDLEVKISTHKG